MAFNEQLTDMKEARTGNMGWASCGNRRLVPTANRWKCTSFASPSTSTVAHKYSVGLDYRKGYSENCRHAGNQTLAAILKDDIVRQFNNTLLFALLSVLTASCNSNKGTFIQTEDQYDTINGKKQIVSQTIKILRQTDSLPITILTRVSNQSNDVRLKYLTGLSKEDGLQDYLLDSIYYDKNGNDTLKNPLFILTTIGSQLRYLLRNLQQTNK